jgi:hypothetical protein
MDIQAYIQKERSKNLSDEEIAQRLTAAGWDPKLIELGLNGEDMPPMAPGQMPATGQPTVADTSKKPIAVVEATSPKSLEYHMMFLTLWLSALGVLFITNVFLFGGGTDNGFSGFALTILLICVPIFLILFFRLRQAEELHPEIKNDLSRKKSIQSTQSLAFIIVLIHTIIMVYQVLNGSGNVGSQVLSWLLSLIVFGSIFVYYWKDTHQAESQD